MSLTLTDMLLEMAEQLTDDGVTGEQLEEKIKRAQALSSVAEQVVNLKEAAVHELDTNMKAVKIAHSCGLVFTPDKNVGLTVGPQLKVIEKKANDDKDDKQEFINDEYPGYKGTEKKGVTPEGLKYEW